MRIEWTPLAEDDRNKQIEDVAIENPAAAIRLGDAVDFSIVKLIDFPVIGRRGRVRGTRELVIPGTKLIAVYRVLPGIVYIVRLLHGAQDWPGSSDG
ncbi:type II toxin-antitoxin system RelE/ParE family toxin [Acidiphilium angustum]|uniref:type II toxin-antitoxin system RelE/ParE family toxin n=1 Tax=Acidiphilium angustum TaxID=523 RepID=UPI0004943BA1|nr:type II toxin-antitoxin system RelE/ParE family toxin [Acidiphilium angustum]